MRDQSEQHVNQVGPTGAHVLTITTAINDMYLPEKGLTFLGPVSMDSLWKINHNTCGTSLPLSTSMGDLKIKKSPAFQVFPVVKSKK